MIKDYPELEGKEIIWEYTDGERIPAVVLGCNYDVGITIAKKEDKLHNLSCYNGPSSPTPFSGMLGREAEYKKHFFFRVRQIKKGIVKGSEGMAHHNLVSVISRINFGKVTSTCPYSGV